MIADEVAGVPAAWSDFLKERGLVYDAQTQVDLLAGALGSQFLLFAGPSGTGKSTAARTLGEFLSGPSRQAVVDVRPGWTSAEDVVGQYSVFTNTYLPGPATEELERLGTSDSESPPILRVEESNLSSIEAYLGDVVTSASETHFESLRIQLHRQVQAQATPEGDDAKLPPSSLTIGPWPRVFGTINVDSTAMAPAPKVSGRACVMLLEPPEIGEALGSTRAISPGSSASAHSPGAALFGDPRRAWASCIVAGEEHLYTDSLKPLLETLRDSAGRGANVVSPRDVQRSILFMSWHVPIALAAAESGADVDASHKAAAELAILHFVLPGLSAEQFGRSLSPLLDAASPDGLLARRLSRLEAGGEGLFGVPADFWASLT